jgi:hypothetical protein
LRFQNDLLALCPDAPLWVDVESFEDAARTVRRVRDLAAYRAAIEPYTGDVCPRIATRGGQTSAGKGCE